MLYGFILAIFTGLTWTSIGIVISLCAKGNFDIIAYSIAQSLFTMIFTAVLYVRPEYISFEETLILLGLVTFGGIVNAYAQLAVKNVMKNGNHGIAWAISQSSFIIPFLAGVLIFGQTGTICNWLGTILVMSGLMTSTKWNYPAELKFVKRALGAFFLFGIVQVLYSVPSQIPGWADNAQLRPSLCCFGGLLGWGGIMVRSGKLPIYNKRIIALAFFMALLSLISLKSFFCSLDYLGACRLGNIGIPLIVGTNIIGFSFYSFFILKEKLHWNECLGALFILLGIIIIGF